MIDLMESGPERTHTFLTICLDKSGNKKRTSKSFSISVSSYRKLRDSSLTNIPVFVVLCLKIVENIDQIFLLFVH